MRYIYISVAIWLINISAYAGDYINLSAQTIKYNNQKILAINFENKPKWHTYWKNPGDSGLAIQVNFSINDKPLPLKGLTWPAPIRFIEQGDIWAYGYKDSYTLFYHLDNDLQGSQVNVKVNALICHEICIPDQSDFNLNFDENLNTSYKETLAGDEVLERLKNLPQEKESLPHFKISLVKADADNKLALHYIIEDVDKSKIPTKSNILTPYLTKNFDYKHEESFYDENTRVLVGRFLIDWDGVYQDPPVELPEDGILSQTVDTKFLIHYPKSMPAKIITQSFERFELYGNNAFTEMSKKLIPVNELNEKSINNVSSSPSITIWYYFLFALLGGMILNIMPCVLPVISLKLFSLIEHQSLPKKQILIHNLFYSLGILITFYLLAITILIIQKSGHYIGWGFQLSSPSFVYILLVGIFIFGLNMFGLFEFKTPGGQSLGKVHFKNPYLNDFSNGVLATILSTPCSAPFLGTALGFAFTAGTLEIFFIFTGVSIGLASPFLLTGIFPKMISFLPRPGEWMNKAKYFLGLSLIGTAIWLFDVLLSLVNGSPYGVYILSLLLMIFFCFYSSKHIFKSKLLPALIFVIFVGLSGYLFSLPEFHQQPINTQINSSWKNWSPEKMKELQQSKTATFVDFTAQWCLTCKVNKKLVLDTDEFKTFAKSKNLILLRGDWTKQDPSITTFLQRYNIVGVPAYFVISDKGEIISLGETISINKIKEAITRQ